MGGEKIVQTDAEIVSTKFLHLFYRVQGRVTPRDKKWIGRFKILKANESVILY